MLKNFFKITVRHLWRNKGFSVINIAGLAIGMAAAMLILLWVHQEVSFDRFHEKTGRIGLLYSRENINGRAQVWNATPGLMAPLLKANFPEVEDVVRYRIVYFLLTAGGDRSGLPPSAAGQDEKHLNVQGAFADSFMLSVFSYPLLQGNPKQVLTDNHSIVLTRKLAEQLFGQEDPMGKTVRIDSTDQFRVTGVLKDLPPNTELNFDYLLPWSYLTRLGWDAANTWRITDANTYVLLKEGASAAAFDRAIRPIVHQHVSTGDGAAREVIRQPLSRVHLYSRAENGELVGGRISMVRLFTLIAVFILLIACINFMNLSTARSERRAREVGIRKVAGARRISLVLQFIGESTILAVIGFLLAICIVKGSLSGFQQLVGSSLTIEWGNPYFWLAAAGFIGFTGLAAGSYPAFYLSSAEPVRVLKGRARPANTLIRPRQFLVVLQFSFAILLIICTIIVERQVQYARGRDTGYARNNLVFNFTQGDVNAHYELIRQDLLRSGAAVAVTKATAPIVRNFNTITGLTWPGSRESDKSINFETLGVDGHFVQTTGMQLVAGRDIDLQTWKTDSSALLLNETAVKVMGLKDPVGKTVTRGDGTLLHVVGVVRDFIAGSPYELVRPMAILSQTQGFGVVHFRLNPAHRPAEDLALAEQVFKRYNPQYPFEYYFVDEFYGRKFREEEQEGVLVALFAGLTIFISCLGLFGLAAYMAESRVKEIGVRKVLGASVTGIAGLLSMEFVKLVLIAFLIASPVAWVVLHGWLQGFQYRVEISWIVFLVAGVLAIGVALLTVGYQAVRAAMANPAKSLRSE